MSVRFVIQFVHEVVQSDVCAEVPPRCEAFGEYGVEPDLLLGSDILRRHDCLVASIYIRK